jgi:hypothetical protein
MQIERLGHELHRLALEHACLVFAADGDDPRGAVTFWKLHAVVDELKPVHDRHAQVGEQHVEALGKQEPQPLLAVASDGALGPLEPRGGGRYEATYVAPSRSPGGAPTLRVADAGGTFEQRFPLPLRENPRRLLVGPRLGWSTALDDLSSPRVGLDVWSPFQLGSVWLGAGVSATVARARQTVTDPGTGLESTSELTYAPVTLRLGWEVLATRRLSLVVGAGGTLAWASSQSSLVSTASTATGFGGLGFVSAGWALGPGQLFGELSYGAARVSSPELELNAGGLTVDLGYRLGIF